MGWLSGIGDALSGVADFVGNNASWLVPAATSVAGAVVGSNANADALAAQTAANADAQKANTQAAEAARADLNAGKQRGVAAITAGTQGYKDTITPMLSADYDATGLTPAQQLQLADVYRSGNAQIAASGLRGAGRAGPLAVMEAGNQYKANALQTNQQRQDTARQGLAGIYANQGTAIANTEVGTGSRLAGTETNQGATAANLSVTQGENIGNAATADSGVYQKTLGNLSALVTDQTERAKAAKYPDGVPPSGSAGASGGW
jgi:hypothetical protein